MRRTLVEPSKRVPIVGDYDVVVVGGGIAGVSAAVAASRQGARVCLIEKACALGGLATLGIVTVYLPLCDGTGRQVVGGLGEELLKLSVADGSGESVPACWRRGGDRDERRRRRYQVRFNPASYLMALEALALRSGVALMYDTRFCTVRMRRRRVDAVLIENKSGRGAVVCRAVVDASGDADVCAAAGERTTSLATNVACGWFYTLDGEGRTRLEPFTLPFDLDALRVPPGGGRGFVGDEADDVTAQLIETRRAIRRRIARMRRRPGQEGLHPLMLPSVPTFRMTRRLHKPWEMSKADDRRFFDDAVGMIGSWLDDGLVFSIPLRALTAEKTTNLLAAGRCIAAEATAGNYTRTIPACAVTGQAAGVAAAMVARPRAGGVGRLDLASLHQNLKAQKVILDPRRIAARDD